MIDVGILFTGMAAAVCLAYGKGIWLRRVLFIAWLASMLLAMMGQTRGVVVAGMASIDLIVAMIALVRFTQDNHKREAQIVGGLSMCLMPAHFIMAASHGRADWTIYISACNAVFVLQCLVAGGWLDGVGRSIAVIWRGVRPVRSFRDGGR